MQITLTDAMKTEAKKQNSQNYDELGFLGKYASMELFELDWHENVDETFFEYDESLIHVKTYLVPEKYYTNILSGDSEDDDPYAMRTFTKKEFETLDKYNIILFGLCVENDLDTWYPVGYLSTRMILKNCSLSLSIPSSGLKPIIDLM